MDHILSAGEKNRLVTKLAGHDDFELVILRAGDVRKLLVEVEALRPPNLIVINVDPAPSGGYHPVSIPRPPAYT